MADSSIDWEAIERSPDFRALVSSRRRFVTRWGGGAVALCAAMVLVAYAMTPVARWALATRADHGITTHSG